MCAGRHRACPLTAAGMAGMVGAAHTAGGAAAAFHHHRAWAEFRVPLQRDHDAWRARDLRVEHGARLSLATLSTDRSDASAGHSAWH